jgi:hypothetical protein
VNRGSHVIAILLGSTTGERWAEMLVGLEAIEADE